MVGADADVCVDSGTDGGSSGDNFRATKAEVLEPYDDDQGLGILGAWDGWPFEYFRSGLFLMMNVSEVK